MHSDNRWMETVYRKPSDQARCEVSNCFQLPKADLDFTRPRTAKDSRSLILIGDHGFPILLSSLIPSNRSFYAFEPGLHRSQCIWFVVRR